MTNTAKVKERWEGIARGDADALRDLSQLGVETLAEIERLEAELEQRDIAVKARAWDKNDEKNDEIARLRTERDEAVRLISALNVWFRKTQSNDEGGHAGANYLNGDSDIHPGNGWEDIERIAEKGADFLAKHKEAGADG